MNTDRCNDLIGRFENINCMVPYTARQRAEITDIIKFGITSGFFQEVERKNLYTFGGVSISLTDTELAMVISYLVDKKNIQAIKTLRCDIPYREISLKEAKDFADHLGNVVNKVKLPD